MVKQKCQFIFKTNGILKWPNLNDQKIPKQSEFFNRSNTGHFKNQICLKKNSEIFVLPWVLKRGSTVTTCLCAHIFLMHVLSFYMKCIHQKSMHFYKQAVTVITQHYF